MVNQYSMIMIPILFFLIANFIFSSASYTQSALDTQMDIIKANTWTDPDDTKYDTFFGNNPIGWFADNVFIFFEKVVATVALVAIAITPPAEIAASIVFGFILSVYVGMYIMLGIGIYKVISPFA